MNEQTFGQINVEKLADITANTIAAVTSFIDKTKPEDWKEEDYERIKMSLE